MASELERIAERIVAVRAVRTNDFADLMKASGLDPARHFRFANWRGADFGDANLRGVDFTGALLEGAQFEGALIGAGLDWAGEQAVAARFDRAVVGRVASDAPMAYLSKCADFREYRRSWTPAADNARDTFIDGDIFRDAPSAPIMIVVPSGSVRMAPVFKTVVEASVAGFEIADPQQRMARPEAKSRTATHVRTFAVSPYPTTVTQWEQYLAAEGKSSARFNTAALEAERPVMRVSWHEAQAYTKWLSKMTTRPYRLLEEKEAEYCLVAGGEQINYTSDSPSEEWYSRPRDREEIGFAPNKWGLFDFARYSLEWCAEEVHDADNETHAEEKGYVCRGADGQLYAKHRSAYRSVIRADKSLPYVGFRVARSLM